MALIRVFKWPMLWKQYKKYNAKTLAINGEILVDIVDGSVYFCVSGLIF